jgi:hypothetical protein
VKRAKSAEVENAESAPAERRPPALSVVRDDAPLPVLATARLRAIDGDRIAIELGGREREATRHPSVHPVVLAGALARDERVLVEVSEGGAAQIIGALRTQPTPGLDAADAYTIEADHIALRATSEVSLTAETAGLVLRAIGEIEGYAERIVSRAEGVHKIIGRVLRLN